MASTSLTVITPSLLGVSVATNSDVLTSGQTITFTVSTAQSGINGSKFLIRAYNAMSAETAVITVGVGTEGSSFGIGGATISTVSSASSVIIGGQGFDTSRFVTSANTVVVTATTGDAWKLEAYQLPRAIE